MQEISVSIIEKAIYQMCKDANIFLPLEVYEKIESASHYDEQNTYILQKPYRCIILRNVLPRHPGEYIIHHLSDSFKLNRVTLVSLDYNLDTVITLEY